MKKLNVTSWCKAIYNGSIDIPDDNMTLKEAIQYAKEHIDEISISQLDYVSGSDELDEENCDFEENNF